MILYIDTGAYGSESYKHFLQKNFSTYIELDEENFYKFNPSRYIVAGFIPAFYQLYLNESAVIVDYEIQAIIQEPVERTCYNYRKYLAGNGQLSLPKWIKEYGYKVTNVYYYLFGRSLNKDKPFDLDIAKRRVQINPEIMKLEDFDIEILPEKLPTYCFTDEEINLIKKMNIEDTIIYNAHEER